MDGWTPNQYHLNIIVNIIICLKGRKKRRDRVKWQDSIWHWQAPGTKQRHKYWHDSTIITVAWHILFVYLSVCLLLSLMLAEGSCFLFGEPSLPNSLRILCRGLIQFPSSSQAIGLSHLPSHSSWIIMASPSVKWKGTLDFDKTCRKKVLLSPEDADLVKY